MKFSKRHFQFSLLLFLLLSGKAFSQHADSVLYKQAADNLIALYKMQTGSAQHLYNGTEYAFLGHNINGTPYFESSEAQMGSVFYDGYLYENIPMYYDMISHVLVIKDYSNNYPVMLVQSKIKYFVLAGHRFINTGGENISAAGTASQFYDELYHGNILLLAKREKQLLLSSNAESNDSKYQQYNYYYVYKNETLYGISNERTLVTVLKDKKELVKKYIRANRLNFKKDFETAAENTIRYYDQLRN